MDQLGRLDIPCMCVCVCEAMFRAKGMALIAVRDFIAPHRSFMRVVTCISDIEQGQCTSADLSEVNSSCKLITFHWGTMLQIVMS